MTDAIKAPAHYTGGEIEPKDLILAGCFPHYVASAIEYLWRHRLKNGAEDLRKAAQCLRMHAEAFQKENTYKMVCESLEGIGPYKIDQVSAFCKTAGWEFCGILEFCKISTIQKMITKIEASADAYEQKETNND